MKNTIIKIFAILSVAFLSAGCIKETFPTGGTITSEQMAASPNSLQYLVNGLPAAMMTSGTAGYFSEYGYHADFGIAAIHLMTESMLEDYTVLGDLGYFWFGSFFQNVGMGAIYIYPAYFWDCYYTWIKLANDIIAKAGTVDESTDSSVLSALGQAYAYRAMYYLDLARLYEPKDYSEAVPEEIRGLTVPIVTELTTEEDAKFNPRAEREDMYDFIFSDLETALEYISEADKSYTRPTHGAIYGMYARAYLELGGTYKELGETTMADNNYARAAYYARKAVEVSGKTPLTEAQWSDPRTGFNSGSANNAWIWGLTLSSENSSNLVSSISHRSPEAIYGYASLHHPGVNKAMYERINFADFRKKSWLDPDYTWKPSSENYDPDSYQFCGKDDALTGYEAYGFTNAYDYFMYDAAPYESIKFRPANGQCVDYTEGNCADHMLMRVEEMYFIEIEAAAQMSRNVTVRVDEDEVPELIKGGLDEAKTLLNSFMRTYRYRSYDCSRITSHTLFIQEMLFQKRVEFWGEGILFYDYKRLDQGISRGYPGTNFPAIARFNTAERSPQWNILIPQAEYQSNTAIAGLNNPDPTEKLVPWTE